MSNYENGYLDGYKDGKTDGYTQGYGAAEVYQESKARFEAGLDGEVVDSQSPCGPDCSCQDEPGADGDDVKLLRQDDVTYALGVISSELASRSGAWDGQAPSWFPEPPEWLELLDNSLKIAELEREKREIKNEIDDAVARLHQPVDLGVKIVVSEDIPSGQWFLTTLDISTPEALDTVVKEITDGLS